MIQPHQAPFLERIVAATRAHLDERRQQTPLDALRALASDTPPPRSFAEALRPQAGGPARLIAEIKRASPSKGLLAERFDPVAHPFGHGARHTLPGGRVLFDSYHCSRYNTNTGVLTPDMFRSVFAKVKVDLD